MTPAGKTAIREARRWISQGGIILALAFLIGEAAFRLPWVDGLLAYEYDAQLGWRLAPGQSGRIFMGNLTFLSPRVRLNGDGFRNGDLDWGAPKILCLGSSEAMGLGVEEDEVWTRRLEGRLRPLLPGVDVVNAAGPGYGPYHCKTVLDRFLERKTPMMVVVRVSIGDREFRPPGREELGRLRRKSERQRRLLAVSRFLPFVWHKARAQAMAIRDLVPRWDGAADSGRESDRAETGIRMWEEQREHLRAIAETCAARSIPALLFVDDPLDTEAGKALADGIREGVAGSEVTVGRLGGEWFDIEATGPEERVEEYERRYMLVGDPHSNPSKHERVAAYVLDMLTREGAGFLAGGRPGKR